MKTKDKSVNIKDVKQVLKDYFALIEDIVKKVEGYSYSITITSGRDGKHSKNSLHYEGLAIDIRTRDMKNVKEVVRQLKRSLDYVLDIVLERDHIHIEYDPKYNINI